MVAYTRKLLLHPVMKVVVVVAFVLLAVFAGWSASKLEQAFDYRGVLPSDSYYTDFLESTQKFTASKPYFAEVYFRNVDQSDPVIQTQMENYVNDLVAMDSVKQQPDFFWLRDFKVYGNQTKGAHDLPFFLQVELFLSDPVYYELYHNQIIRNLSGDVIESRTYIFIDNVDPEVIVQQLQAFHDVMNVTKTQPINDGIDNLAFFAYSIVFK
jgi:Niemann-Pick C1 protein